MPKPDIAGLALQRDLYESRFIKLHMRACQGMGPEVGFSPIEHARPSASFPGGDGRRQLVAKG